MENFFSVDCAKLSVCYSMSRLLSCVFVLPLRLDRAGCGRWDMTECVTVNFQSRVLVSSGTQSAL